MPHSCPWCDFACNCDALEEGRDCDHDCDPDVLIDEFGEFEATYDDDDDDDINDEDWGD
jgi:hypothetical protein